MRTRVKNLIVVSLSLLMVFGILFQSVPVQATETDNELNVVYYNQGDYPDSKIGTSTIKAAGCGPVCVAVCYSSLTGKKVSIPKICKLAYKKGWYINGAGCTHYVIPGLSKEYGLKSKGLGTNMNAIKKALKAGHPVVALMGAGDFTGSGHFIVVTKLVGNNRVEVADVGSRARTAQTWSLKKIVRQSKDYADAGGPFWEISLPFKEKETINNGMISTQKTVDIKTIAKIED
ncbi:MAG: C39 family peptidase [Anaerostipes sp.]|nr:C39 family peptidase [Anaerostipes sp.]